MENDKSQEPKKETTTIHRQEYYDSLLAIHANDGMLKMNFGSSIPNSHGPTGFKTLQLVLPLNQIITIKETFEKLTAQFVVAPKENTKKD